AGGLPCLGGEQTQTILVIADQRRIAIRRRTAASRLRNIDPLDARGAASARLCAGEQHGGLELAHVALPGTRGELVLGLGRQLARTLAPRSRRDVARQRADVLRLASQARQLDCDAAQAVVE